MKLWILFLISAVIGFSLSFFLGYVVIPWLHKLKFGQTILDIGPSWHKNKEGTPTMGGMLFIIGTVVSFFVAVIVGKLCNIDIVGGDSIIAPKVKLKLYAGIIMAICFAFIGFLDDFIKVKQKQNLGLTIKQKTLLQAVVMVGYLLTLGLAGSTYMYIPFVGNVDLKLGFYVFGLVVMYCTVNAVNFTDGIDGLCSSVTATFAVAGIVIGVMRGMLGTSLLCASLFASLIGYLIWNWNPAKVMMGDFGSMFLGGMVVAVAYSVDMPWLILLMGIIYVIEFMSDIIQIVYFKATHGKRLFKMAPIHHHFEKCGWKEKKICVVFSAVNAIGCVIACLLVCFGQVAV